MIACDLDPDTLTARCRALIEELGLGRAADVGAVTPLTGGVASDIARVELGGRALCVKFALPRLRVAADWRAPVHRNAAEYAWLSVAAQVCPDSAVALLGRSETQHGFAMEYLEGQGVTLWKAALLEGRARGGEAGQVADLLGRIHAQSATPGFDRTPFDNRKDFYALRIEPYLVEAGRVHRDLADPLRALAAMLYDSAQVLVHGDVSPKNILFRDSGPVLLDAECATMGDASFDLSFCLNHLVLKAAHLPGSRALLGAEIASFWQAYAPHVTWEPAAALEARVCRLLPGLMLARQQAASRRSSTLPPPRGRRSAPCRGS
ncbi:phosphotransferase family protein [Pseudoponticoccus marisrubri]|uniref:Aminoglycoside phosphotransferase domain-containing protein n=1 Tax=Pseudoponticoccus marisrubri TaxID=1685382 RepID=A0A0W7WHA3_9RHOB|nr:aminoglycoside phosphotransferase family protein [Pseudoponticoccus marisrubri]KUF09876.1 hypothetical protein AVJ23_15660 [Pseudoponticoccus marisrubri]